MIDGVYWTLAVEFKFYVLVFVLIVAKQMKRIELWVYGWLAALLGASAIDSGALASLTLWPHGYFFVGGAICYLLRSRGFTWPRAAALLVTAGASMYETTQTAGDFTWAPFVADPAYVCGILVACYCAILAISLRAISLPGAAFLSALGALTYPLYLLHGQLGRVARATFLAELPSLTKLLIAAALAYALAWVCSQYAEPAFRSLVASALDRAVSLGRRGRAAVPEAPQA
jgi:peptidoglycan/LPS O-acetylase OafA/YrhL